MSRISWVTEKVKKHKKMTVAGVVILTFAIMGSNVVGKINKRKEQIEALMNQIQTSQIERRTLVSSVSATGTLTSVNSKDVVVALNGVEVKSVSVQLGDMVEAGQVLCEFDSEDIEEGLAEAKTSLSVTNQKTQMDLTAAERNLEDAKADYDTELKRGNTDLGVAYNDYVEAVEEEEEALEAWESAKATTGEKEAEYELRQSRLSVKKKDLEVAKSAVDRFAAKKSELETVANSGGFTLDMSKISLENTEENFGFTYNAEDSSGDANIISNPEVWALIEELNGLRDSYSTVTQLEAEYAALQQEVSAWQTKYNTAKSNETSYEKAYEQAVSTSKSKLQTYEKQQRTLEDTTKSAENAVISKTESLTTAQLNALGSGNSEEDKVEEYQQQLEDCTVEAPISGVISAVNIEAGDTYSGTAIVTIDDISSFEVTTEIDEYDIGKIEKGQKVVIKTNATGDEELKGTVKTVSPKASTGGSEVTYTVIISVDTPHEMLRMDMTAKLSIILESKENVLTVPYEAVQEEESGNCYVEVVDDIPERNQNTVNNVKNEKMSQMQSDMNSGSIPQGMDNRNTPQMPDGNSMKESDVTTRKIYIEKGIESDYYIEIISDEIREGMEVVVPKTSDDFSNIQSMIQGRGPMGGF